MGRFLFRLLCSKKTGRYTAAAMIAATNMSSAEPVKNENANPKIKPLPQFLLMVTLQKRKSNRPKKVFTNGLNIKAGCLASCFYVFGLGEKIRTSGLLNPIQARYQTAPHPERLRAVRFSRTLNIVAFRRVFVKCLQRYVF